jgi:hypothetical protein
MVPFMEQEGEEKHFLLIIIAKEEKGTKESLS